jgi:hypothetical protein
METTRKHVQCLSCGGTYFTRTNDGFPYFHECPPQIVDDPGEVNEKTGEIVRPHTYKQTPSPRNENLVHNLDPRAPREIISKGLGVKEIA